MKRTYTYRKFWLFFGILFCQSLHAQVKNVGPVLSYQKTNAGIEGKTSSAIFEVRAYNDNTIRVRVSRKHSFDNFSYALVSTEFPVFNSNVMDKGKTIEIATKDITVVVEKVPAFRVRFLNRAGQVINEDVAGDGFGTTFIGDKVSSYKVLQEGERFVGLGEVLGNLDKRGSGFTLNNTDTYKYGDPRLSMYISIPFYIGIHHDLVYGLFYHNTYKTFFNFGLSTPFTSINAEGGDADYFLVYDTSVANILKHYSSLTGRMLLPPKWSIGYHQSRCSYYPQENVKIIAETFRKKQIPVDCIVLDADYLQDYEPFRINTERFPDMRGLTDHLRKLNIEVTASVNPGIKIDSGYEAHRDGLKKDVFVKYSNGDLFVSDIAPSTNHFVDFTNPKSRQWWIDKMKFLPDNGIQGYWNDMNEPAVGGSYLPDNLLFDFDGKKANALEAKNVYGFQMARSSFESALKYGKGRRPFVLTRSAFAGVQRYSAVWSGDNTSSDEGLLSGVLLNSQMGLTGLPFVGPDLGGYIGDGTKDLFKRWMEVGVFSPFVRNHKGFFTPANEPWSYGEEAEAISKSYIGFRYRLMPYIYSKFYEASQTGIPVARSLALNYPFNEKVYDNLYQYQFLFGDALMVVPVTTQEAVKKVYLPEGEWFDMFTDSLYKGQQEFYKENPIYQIPIYVKGSSIIPMQTLVQSTKDKTSDTLFIHIYNGTAHNDFEYYEDEGDGFDYQKKGYYKRTISFKPAEREVKLSAVEGGFPSVFKKLQLVFHGLNNKENFRINKHSETTMTLNKKVLDPLEYLADYYDKNFYKSLRAAEVVPMNKAITIDNSREEIIVKW